MTLKICRSWSKVVIHDTPHSSGHLCQIWNESTKNCWHHRAETIKFAIFRSFYRKVTVEWPWRCRSRSKFVIHGTPSHSSDHLCQIWNESNKNCRHHRAETTKFAIFRSFYHKFTVEWPWRCWSRSKVVLHDTPSHSSGHLCQIWNESTKNCRHHRAETIRNGRSDGRTNEPTDRLIPVYPSPHTHTPTSLWGV